MFRVCLFLSLLGLSSAVKFSYSTVITSADVPQNQPTALDVNSGTSYRIYATFSSVGSQEYAKNVFISDNTATYSVYGLDQAMPGSVYVLEKIRELRAPITVHDKNVAGTERVPFTIYAVDSSVITFPVVSARLAPTGEVDSNNGWLAAGVTVLSAEQYFTMYTFDIGSVSSMFINSVGYDEGNAQYNLMQLYSARNAQISFLTVYGPIATLFNSNWGLNARFKFQFTKNTRYDYGISPGANFALMSPGYCSPSVSYNTPYTNPDALDRTISFGQYNWVTAYYNAGDFQSGENVNFQFINSDNQPVNVNLNNQVSKAVQTQWAGQVALKVTHPNANHVPNFLFQVVSGSSLSFSLLGVLLVSLFVKL